MKAGLRLVTDSEVGVVGLATDIGDALGSLGLATGPGIAVGPVVAMETGTGVGLGLLMVLATGMGVVGLGLGEVAPPSSANVYFNAKLSSF